MNAIYSLFLKERLFSFSSKAIIPLMVWIQLVYQILKIFFTILCSILRVLPSHADKVLNTGNIGPAPQFVLFCFARTVRFAVPSVVAEMTLGFENCAIRALQYHGHRHTKVTCFNQRMALHVGESVRASWYGRARAMAILINRAWSSAHF